MVILFRSKIAYDCKRQKKAEERVDSSVLKTMEYASSGVDYRCLTASILSNQMAKSAMADKM